MRRLLPLLVTPLLLRAGSLAAEEPVAARQVVAGKHVHVAGDVELSLLEEAVASCHRAAIKLVDG